MASLAALLSQLDPNPHRRGRQWERICRWYLRNDPVYRRQVRRVWHWKDWPDRWGIDAGIDLVAELSDGTLLAVQAKAYAADYSITKADVDSFLSESARPRFTRRLVIGTTNHIGTTALRTIRGQRVPAKFVALGDLERSVVDWPTHPDDLRARRVLPKSAHEYQREAVDAISRGLQTHDRGKVVMACGTGKTLVGLWIAERLDAERTLVLFPSLTLLAQTLREWTANARQPFETLAVCSDSSVADADALVEHASDLDVRVTTDPRAIRAFLRRPGARVVFATYQSSPELAKAMRTRGVPEFDLAIADEAHRCAGRVGGDFATILDQKAIRAHKRLFMTATPRYFTGRIRHEAAAADYEVASMDDPLHFGPLLHELTFGMAIKKGLLSDYQVAIVGIDDATYRDYAQRGVFVTVDGTRITNARELAGQIGLARAMRKFDLHKTLTFHGRVAGARSFSSEFPKVVAWMPAGTRPSGRLWSRYVSGEMPSGDRDTLLSGFRELDRGERGLLSNARCLSEGVDVPEIDGVAFIDPRRSQIDIVQAVGRAIRKSAKKRIGTIVLPVFVDTAANLETALSSTAFEPVWRVLRALRAHDESLGEELDELRRGLGRRSTNELKLPGKIKFLLPVAVDQRFASALELRIVDQTTTSWLSWFGRLEKYAAREGTSLVPGDHVEAGFLLGRWVTKQRSHRAQMSADRSRRLEALPKWTWDTDETAWEEGFRCLLAYVGQNSSADVPTGHKQTGYPLSRWVNNQRSFRKQGRLSSERIARLDAVPGWVWNERDAAWLKGLERLRHFHRRTGHARIPTDYVDEAQYKLGQWVFNSRSFHNRGALSAERARLIEETPGWTWSAHALEWQDAFERLSRWVDRRGTASIKQTERDADGYGLGSWAGRQRRLLKAGQLPHEYARRLETIPGWTWSPASPATRGGSVPET